MFSWVFFFLSLEKREIICVLGRILLIRFGGFIS